MAILEIPAGALVDRQVEKVCRHWSASHKEGHGFTGCGKTPESYTNGKGTSSTRAVSRARALRLEPLGESSHEQEAFFRNLFSRAATVGSSRVDLQACKLEYSIVSPK